MVRMEISEPMPLKGGDEGDVLQRIQVKAASAEHNSYEPWLVDAYDSYGADKNLVYLFDRLDYQQTWRVCDAGGKFLRYELMPFGGFYGGTAIEPYTDDAAAIKHDVCQNLKRFNIEGRVTTGEPIYLRRLETTCSIHMRMVLNAALYNQNWSCATIDRVNDEMPQPWQQDLYEAVREYYNGTSERSQFAVFYGRMAGDENGESMIYLFDRQDIDCLYVRNFHNDTPSEYFVLPVGWMSAVAPTEVEVERLARQVLLPQYTRGLRAPKVNANEVSLELVPCTANPRILHKHDIEVHMYLDGLQL